MKEFEKGELENLEECGRCMMTIPETAIILEVDESELVKEMNNKTSVAFRTYNRGRLKGEIEVRKSILSMAGQGATQAQTLYMNLRNELKILEA